MLQMNLERQSKEVAEPWTERRLPKDGESLLRATAFEWVTFCKL